MIAYLIAFLTVALAKFTFLGLFSFLLLFALYLFFKYDAKILFLFSLLIIIVAAVELGLGTCWIGAFDKQKVSKLLNVPEHLETVALLTVGYPKEEPGATPRKPLNEIVCYEKYDLHE